jgi:hypothetical protein
MKLYLITQEVNNDYDTYDSAVVCAENEDKARMIHPGVIEDWDGEQKTWSTWCSSKDVDVRLIGTARKGILEGVVCASFNAG